MKCIDNLSKANSGYVNTIKQVSAASQQRSRHAPSSQCWLPVSPAVGEHTLPFFGEVGIMPPSLLKWPKNTELLLHLDKSQQAVGVISGEQTEIPPKLLNLNFMHNHSKS